MKLPLGSAEPVTLATGEPNPQDLAIDGTNVYWTNMSGSIKQVPIAGGEVVTLETPLVRVGLSVCYDLRFPGLYRLMGRVDVILVPSAFTATTGRAHWETLLRARAVYTASISGLEDLAGRKLPDRTWTFRTGDGPDFAAPKRISFSPSGTASPATG